MKWMTKTEVERAAKKGPLAALDNSIEKWTQKLNASAKELKAKLNKTSDYNCRDYCALCVYGRTSLDVWLCDPCPLVKTLGKQCFGLGYSDYINSNTAKEERKAIRTLIRNMKKARKILKEQG